MKKNGYPFEEIVLLIVTLTLLYANRSQHHIQFKKGILLCDMMIDGSTTNFRYSEKSQQLSRGEKKKKNVVKEDKYMIK